MKQQRLIISLVVALLLSGGCTFLLSRRIGGQAAVRSVPDLMYAAPSRSLKAGELLKPDSVELLAWPGTRPISGAFLKTADVVGRVLLYPVEKGEPILEKALSASGAGSGLAAAIPQGMRAIALRSDEVAGVAGFLTPGSHVDVLVTYHASQSPDPVTATVLQDAEVIAVGQRAQPDPEGKPTSVTVVTLLLTPDESQRAVLASSQGSVHFVLRNGADKDRPTSTPMLLSMLGGAAPIAASPAPRPIAARARAATPNAPGIETVLGSEGGSSSPSGSAPQ